MKFRIILRLTQYRFSEGERMWVPSVVLESDDGDHTLWQGDYNKSKVKACAELCRHRPIITRRAGIQEIDCT